MPAGQRRIGFQELGLAYAADAAVTKHLARFLSHQVQNSPEAGNIRRGRNGLACPTHVLFNGGVMKAEVLRKRLVEVLNKKCSIIGSPKKDLMPWARPMFWMHLIWSTQWREGRPITEEPGADREYASGVAPRALTTSESKARCQPSQEWKPR